MTPVFLRKLTLAAAFCCLTVACSRPEAPATEKKETKGAKPGAPTAASPVQGWKLSAARELPSPAAADSGEPFLFAAADGSIVMSWMEKHGSSHELKFSTLRGDSWWQSATVARSDRFFVNWADTPSIVKTEKGALFAHWLQKSADGKYTYDVHVTSSTDGGRNWRKSIVPHTNPHKSEYGFVSMVPQPGKDVVDLLWLDGRNMQEEGVGDMALRFATLDADGKLTGDRIVDPRVCECCQTGMTRTADGLVAVYRDRSEKEVRDTGIVRQNGEEWTAPAILHQDNWTIPGCPVNGPQIDARGSNAVVAWFTEAEQRPRVYVAFSGDSGAQFGAPIVIADGTPLGRVDVAMLRDDLAAVSWLDRSGENGVVRVQLISPGGKVGEPVAVGETDAARKSGFPRIAARAEQLVVTWTGRETRPLLHVAVLSLQHS